MRWFGAVLAAVVVAMATGGVAQAQETGVGYGGGTPGTASDFRLVGHNPLAGRGMNAALAIYRDFVYVGNRTDASDYCPGGATQGCEHRRPGILIVDAEDPQEPEVVGEIGAPHAAQVGITTRELRVLPERKLLIVMTFRCSNALHACAPGTDADFGYDLKFFDLSDPRQPRFISSYVPTSKAGTPVKPHEMHLWTDPVDRNRALLYLSTPSGSRDPARPNLLVVDISDVHAGGQVEHVAEANFNPRYPEGVPTGALHSMGVSADGRRLHLAHLAGGYLFADASQIADNVPDPQVQLVTDPVNRATWARADAHSAFELPGRDIVVTTDEIYGTFTDPTHGCPWGWSHLVDVQNRERPAVVGRYLLEQNLPQFCETAAGQDDEFTSYAAHNPTPLPNLVFATWHSGGLQAYDVRDPSDPRQTGWYSPRPLSAVALEDPALGRGTNKVLMWSFPIIKDGLIYVTDIRNGLYILRYTGPGARTVRRIDFYEGNSNLGDALRLAGG